MPIFVIAEAGVNHNGSPDLAKKLVEAAAAAGADAVKFQTFKAKSLVTKQAPKAEYQHQNTPLNESQFEMLKKLELNEDQHKVLADHCSALKIKFLSSPFDPDSLRFLTETLGVSHIKIASGELTNALLLLEAAKSGRPIILSTGMSTLEEIEKALGVLAFGYGQQNGVPSSDSFMAAYRSAGGRQLLQKNVTLLQCTSEYPAPFDEVHLRTLSVLRDRFQLAIGISDHTPGISVPIAAVACGASVIEKHFTLDRTLPGPDHAASLEPSELKTMIQSIREVDRAMGQAQKAPTPSEMKNRQIARRCLVAASPIRKGDIFTPMNLTVKRPDHGISAIHYWDWIGKVAGRDYSEDEVIG